MKVTSMLLAGAAMLAANASQAQTTIDFNSNPDGRYFVETVQSNGFTATGNMEGGYTPLGTNVAVDNKGPSNGTVHLDSWTNLGSNSIWTLTKNDGSAFSLNSFEYASGTYNNGVTFAGATSLTITGLTALNTTVSQTFGAYSTFTKLTALPVFGNVTKVQFNASGFQNRAAYDNIIVGNAVAAVPESATWAMMIVGMGAIGFGMRRRKTATPLSYAA